MQKLVESYERLWNESADPPDIEEFLSNAQIDLDAVPAKSLLPVILLDQKKRWSAGKPIKVEQYVAKLPFLKDDAAGKAELLLGELIAHGNEVSPEEVDQFASRFPDASEEFKSKLQDYLESKESDASSPTLPKSQQELTATKSIFQDERDGDSSGVPRPELCFWFHPEHDERPVRSKHEGIQEVHPALHRCSDGDDRR